ncbi:UNVERIFIED_CONTAM: hypothetical protein PYX00_010180 [Menopon gallinae]|uniref:Uncharacterized protein n=1 Tax=Menopon gallinae TaxID=328185 RepID=A0AAW2HF29_9NEOP
MKNEASTKIRDLPGPCARRTLLGQSHLERRKSDREEKVTEGFSVLSRSPGQGKLFSPGTEELSKIRINGSWQ